MSKVYHHNGMNSTQEKCITLPPNTIHFWYCRFDLDNFRLPYYNTLLSNDEKRKADKFKFLVDQQKYVTFRGILRILLSRYLDKNPEEILFKYGAFGKPDVKTNTALRFNISHSGNMAVFGFVQNYAIGVDIEKIKQDFDPLDLAKSFFSEEEINALSQAKDSVMFQAFYRCWTRKESFIKAVGEGLSYPLDSFAVTMDNDHRAKFLKIDNDQDSKSNWQLHSFVPTQDYIAAITTKGNPKKIEFFDANDFLS